MVEKDKILKLIEKLFRKTEGNGCTPEEAAAAAAHAQKLLCRYGLSAEEVKLMDESVKADDDKLNKVAVDYAVKPWAWKLQTVVCDNFRCRALIRRSGNEKRVLFFGTERDVLIAKKVFEELYVVGEVLTGKEYRRYTKMTPEERYMHGFPSRWVDYRADWQEGYVQGIKAVLEEQVAQFALIVRPPQAALDAKFRVGHTPAVRGCIGYTEAYTRGEYDGRTVMKTKRIDEQEG